MNEVKLIGIIGGEQGIDVDSIINSWDLAAEEILLCIDSQGGSVSHGFRLYDHIETMRSKGQKVHAKIIGECYSIATVVACACDDVAMNKYGLFMIHSPTISVEDATSDDLRKCAEMTDKVTDNIAQVYAKKTGRTKEEMLTLMQKTAFYNSKEAQDMKLIDRIYNALGEIRNKWNHFHMAA
jgi:ATP-dependent protease ClpP protease subunit